MQGDSGRWQKTAETAVSKAQGELKHGKQGLESAEDRFETEAYGVRRLQRRLR